MTPLNPIKREKSDSSTHTDDPQTTLEVSILANVNKKKLDLLIQLHKEMKETGNNLHSVHENIITPQKANQDLHISRSTLNKLMHGVSKEKKLLKETVLEAAA